MLIKIGSRLSWLLQGPHSVLVSTRDRDPACRNRGGLSLKYSQRSLGADTAVCDLFVHYVNMISLNYYAYYM